MRTAPGTSPLRDQRARVDRLRLGSPALRAAFAKGSRSSMCVMGAKSIAAQQESLLLISVNQRVEARRFRGLADSVFIIFAFSIAL